MFGLFTEKTYRADPQLKQLGYKVHDAYRKASFDNIYANKEKIILIIECFYEVHKRISGESHDGYYLGNLTSSGKLEGKVEDVLGSVEQAVARTINFIRTSDKIHSSQCEYFSRNLKVILEKEIFSEDPQEILSDNLSELDEIARGKVD